MISLETRAQIRRHFYAEHWKIGTIAGELGVHPDTVRQAIEAERFRSTQLLRPSIVDPYAEFIRQILDQHRYDAGSAPTKRAGGVVWRVPERGRHFEDLSLCRTPNADRFRATIHDHRYGRHRHTGRVRDLSDRHPSILLDSHSIR